MCGFGELSHVTWHCPCHIAWAPKVLKRIGARDARDARNCVHIYCGRLGCEIAELNVQPDAFVSRGFAENSHIGFEGHTEGKTALGLPPKLPYVKQRAYSQWREVGITLG